MKPLTLHAQPLQKAMQKANGSLPGVWLYETVLKL